MKDITIEIYQKSKTGIQEPRVTCGIPLELQRKEGRRLVLCKTS
jgi:hypothetical protein